MDSRFKIEQSERQLYNRHAYHKNKLDELPSSRISRRYIINRSLEPILQKREGNLGTILDVGCGIGAAAIHLAPKYNRYIGVDISEKMIEIGKEVTKGMGNVELIVANSKEMPVKPGVADIIFLNGSLHHMTDTRVVMQSLFKHAKPQAWFVALEPQSANPIIQFMRKIRMIIDKSYSKDQIFFSEKDLVRLVKDAGLSNISVEYQGYLLPPLAQVALSPQWLFTLFAKLCVFSERSVEKLMIGPLRKSSWNITVYGQFP